LPSYDEAAFGGKVLRTVFAVDVDSNRSHNVGPVTLGMPVKQFIQKVANALGIEAEHLRIIYSGKQLQEGRSDMNILVLLILWMWIWADEVCCRQDFARL
jgi:hypothetical protein